MQLYELPPSHRTKDRLHNLFRAVWKRQKAQYEEALFPTEDMQREFGLEGLRLLDNYFRVRPSGLGPGYFVPPVVRPS